MSHALRLCLLLPALLAACCANAGERPNILLIVADDLGYGDLGCQGATKILTPHIDRLAGEGVRFSDAHAVAAVCNPSRYSILSGTYLWHAKRKNDYSLYFHDGQVTLPALLKSAGYRTAALGKWHNGFGRAGDPDWNAELKPGPLEIGFDYFFGTPRTHNEPPFVFVENHHVVDLDPADPIRVLPAREAKGGWGHGLSEGGAKAHAARPVEKIDPILADRAVAFMSEKHEAPFFLYLAFLAPHVPLAPGPDFRGKSAAGVYGDFVQQLDACVGKVLVALKAQGLADNTLVLFTSDNGAVLTREALAVGHRSNASRLGQKTDAWEAGHRVPFIARWSGHLPAGTERRELFSQVDLMATLAEAVGAKLPEGASPDGQSAWPAFVDPLHAPATRTEAVFLGTGGHALRQGEWVYLPKQGSCGMTVQVPPSTPWGQLWARLGLTNDTIDAMGHVLPDAPKAQLYAVRSDPDQHHNVIADHPEIAARLQARMDELKLKR